MIGEETKLEMFYDNFVKPRYPPKQLQILKQTKFLKHGHRLGFIPNRFDVDLLVD